MRTSLVYYFLVGMIREKLINLGLVYRVIDLKMGIHSPDKLNLVLLIDFRTFSRVLVEKILGTPP